MKKSAPPAIRLRGGVLKTLKMINHALWIMKQLSNEHYKIK